ncbi:MAG: peptidylprolyl isomerase [Clostridia bacterium]|nr:peptidylprolyl isomerase [Clostridia bacterium]
MNKIFKKAVCTVLSLTAVAGAAFSMSACTTDHPEVELSISFNGSTYTLDYKLYRKYAPNTVNHFIKLAENGYYDGLCVHDYDDSRLYTGAYSYDKANAATDGGLTYKSYYEVVKGYSDFPHSVWLYSGKNTPTYTLYGEFSANGLKVENGTFLQQSYGSLTMYYTDKGDKEATVSVEKINGTGETTKNYEYNSATSQFFIALNTTSKTVNTQCTFATLMDDSKEQLNKLVDAIKAYIETNFSSADDPNAEFVEEVTLDIDEDDHFVGEDGREADYKVPVEPIVVKSVKVTKY